MKVPDYAMSLMSTYGTNLCSGKENGWMMLGPKNEPHSTTLKWCETPSYTITHLMTTTINDTLQLVWKLFGQPNTGPTVCLPFF